MLADMVVTSAHFLGVFELVYLNAPLPSSSLAACHVYQMNICMAGTSLHVSQEPIYMFYGRGWLARRRTRTERLVQDSVSKCDRRVKSAAPR